MCVILDVLLWTETEKEIIETLSQSTLGKDLFTGICK